MRRLILRWNGGQKEATAEKKLKVRDEIESGNYLCVNIQVCGSALASASIWWPRRVDEPWRAPGDAGYGRGGEI